MIDASTHLNLVIGYPLGHTKSPKLHQEIYRLRECNAVLLARPTSPEELSQTIEIIRQFPVKLTAITIPHKETVLKFVDGQSDEVKKLGAANTLINTGGKLIAYNTDTHGIEHAFRNVSLKNKTVLILGAGGAARAAAYVMHKHGANLLVMNRTRSRAEAIIQLFGGTYLDKDSLQDHEIDIIINTTPLGMSPHVDGTPLPDYRFNQKQIVFDMVYNPVDTALLKTAQKHGAVIISGEDMFLGQALKQVELYLNSLEKNHELHTTQKTI